MGIMVSTDKLIEEAIKMKEHAYVPYSKFPVGAALLTKTGKVYTGCNIENAAYPVTCCAERVAIFKAISEGETTFTEMAVAANTDRPVPPCGSCRQVMAEFFSENMEIHMTNVKRDHISLPMKELLPLSFQTNDLT